MLAASIARCGVPHHQGSHATGADPLPPSSLVATMITVCYPLLPRTPAWHAVWLYAIVSIGAQVGRGQDRLLRTIFMQPTIYSLLPTASKDGSVVMLWTQVAITASVHTRPGSTTAGP